MIINIFEKITEIKTPLLFFDGNVWNFLRFDPMRNKILLDYNLSNKENYDNYNNLMQIIDREVQLNIINNKLMLFLDKGRKVVQCLIDIEKGCFRNKKIISSKHINHGNGNIVCSSVKVKNRMKYIGDSNWDLLVYFINKVF